MTNSCVAYYKRCDTKKDGKVVVCHDSKNNVLTPSYVEYKDNEEILVGNKAKDNLLANRHNIIYSVKRLIGIPFNDPEITSYIKHSPVNIVDINGSAGVEVEVDGESRQLLPEEVLTQVICKLKAMAEEDIGHPVLNAVITVPAYFTDAQLEATTNAGIMAGLKILTLINEPTAAALFHKLDRFDDTSSRIVLIYHFGGCTLEVTVLNLSIGEINVIAVGGDNQLGGHDICNNIIDYCLREFYAQTRIMVDRNTVEGDRAYRGLKDQCEKQKCRLSEALKATIAVDNFADGHDMKVELTRAKLEELNKELFARTMDCVTRTLAGVKNGIGMKPDEIDHIVLVGVSTYIPYVKNMIKKYFNGRQPLQSLNPMLVVAEGAAIKAANLNGTQAYLQDNSRVDGIPSTKEYQTACDNQTEIEVKVYEGEDPVATNNTLLGRFVVMNIPPDKAGKQPVSIEFCVSGNGILKVKTTVLSQGTLPEENVGRLFTKELLIIKKFL
ncbi:unnamed protein product [Medioppia subpectinata]|uniref:Heat shock protein 70 n=1 Tax=Medioppia subpectinata TaxID=1979941 RepID=A0A7R9KIW3_9ACAR|nr:unnamed protein product [Medioppia subpectinata]CAG2104092.1 unnamed protein product [Medioppia subpectinata]